MKRALFTVISVLACASAGAAAECSEKITMVIVHTNDNVYFQTDKTCINWCQVAMTTQSANSKSYALLLAAQAQGRNVVLHWPNLTACTQTNATYAAPAFIALPAA